jgi:RNA-directed DNA polymerase
LCVGCGRGRVSAVSARSTLATVGNDRTRALQHALYRAAKADPTRRFHALFDKVCRRDVLDRAWEGVRRNRGAAGIDRVTLATVEEYGVARLLDELVTELRERRYRPLPARRVFIPSRAAASSGRCRSLRCVTASCRRR